MGFLFWLFTILSLVLSGLALMYKKPIFLVMATILILPCSLYLAATPLFRWWGLLLPLFYIGAAYFIWKYKFWASILLISPNLLVIGWLGFAVLSER